MKLYMVQVRSMRIGVHIGQRSKDFSTVYGPCPHEAPVLLITKNLSLTYTHTPTSTTHHTDTIHTHAHIQTHTHSHTLTHIKHTLICMSCQRCSKQFLFIKKKTLALPKMQLTKVECSFLWARNQSQNGPGESINNSNK